MNRLTKWKLARLGRTGAYRSDMVVFSRHNKLLVGLRVQDIVLEFKRVRYARMNAGRFRNRRVRGRMDPF